MGKTADTAVHVALDPRVGGQLPGAVVGGVDDQGVLIQLQFAKGFQDLAG